MRCGRFAHLSLCRKEDRKNEVPTFVTFTVMVRKGFTFALLTFLESCPQIELNLMIR